VDAFMENADSRALFGSVLSRYVCKDPYTTMAMSLQRRITPPVEEPKEE